MQRSQKNSHYLIRDIEYSAKATEQRITALFVHPLQLGLCSGVILGYSDINKITLGNENIEMLILYLTGKKIML